MFFLLLRYHLFSLFLENIDQDLTDGILRKADMPIVDTILCQEFLDVNARSDEMHSGFICAGGKGDEESCYVSQWNNLGILWDPPYLPIKIQNFFTKNKRDICPLQRSQVSGTLMGN